MELDTPNFNCNGIPKMNPNQVVLNQTTTDSSKVLLQNPLIDDSKTNEKRISLIGLILVV